MTDFVFPNRAAAGRLLAEVLVKFANRPEVVVLGLPCGGVPVAYEVAKALEVPLDVVVVRKLGLPGWKELAMGAIASGGVQILNDDVVQGFNIGPECLNRVVAEESAKLQRHEIAFRGHPGVPDVKGRTVILVDDGIATGSSIYAAVRALRQQDPARIVIAVPSAAAESCGILEPLVDEFVSLLRPIDFHAVGHWYGDFQAISDSEVKHLLAQAATLRSGT